MFENQNFLAEKSPLSERQLFEFDLNGYLIIPGFLSAAEIAAARAALDARPESRASHKFDFLDFDPVFLRIARDPRVLAVASYLLGENFRFDHAFAYQDGPAGQDGAAVENLHAGPYAEQGIFQYHWHGGRPRSGPIVFCYALDDVAGGDGGLVFVPGSHKSNVPVDGHYVFNHLLSGRLDADWIHNPPLRAGDLVLFTEAVIHGTRRWRPADRGRVNLYYQYCPGYAIWHKLEKGGGSRAGADPLFREPYVSDKVFRDGRYVNQWRPATKAYPGAAFKLRDLTLKNIRARLRRLFGRLPR
ncbi:MAG TPA: phytanoyl-CoA dioxygenase family protein [Candidatus Eisenbacteria bacterium]|nr:phytanoyl-CoA dioxygenase family protein [Candidatus Eisenbacteria bacterium]